MALRFSTLARQDLLSRLRSEDFDLLVIGGGITGAGIALDASSRGLRVAVVEKGDFASGTSSKSTKLIHGGLRYLKQLEFGLVKEVGSERAIVHALAPWLVIPEKMLLPLSEGKSFGYWMTSIGLMIYDWLAGVQKTDRRRMLTRARTLRQEPLLIDNDIKGGALYSEYRTDDARLTIEIMKAAFHYGAVSVNYLQVTDFHYDNGSVSGVNAKDLFTEEPILIRSKVIVNAAGPWVDELRDIDKSKKRKRLHLTKGVHIVVPRQKLPVRQAIYFDVGDGRMIFAIPRGRTTYIGTTDTNYDGDKNNVAITAGDVEYLLGAVNNTFQNTRLSISDVESAWAGLRPLIHEEGKSASELSRKDEIFESPSGLISIAGGKLTGYRKMAERVVDLVIKKYFDNRQLKTCETFRIKLANHSFLSFRDVRKYFRQIYIRSRSAGFGEITARYLVENYGHQASQILDYYDEDIALPADKELVLLRSELKFAVNQEMTMTLSDFFARRTGLLYFDIHKVMKWKNEIAADMANLLGWTDSIKRDELARLDGLLYEATHFA